MDSTVTGVRPEPSSVRTLVLAAAGAMIGLAIAGFGLFTAKGSRISIVPPEDAAIVNGTPILAVDFEMQLRALYGLQSLSDASPDQRHRVLEDMIREELFVQRGVELGLASVDSDARGALVAAVEQQLDAELLSRRPTEQQLREYYEKHPDKYSTEGRLLVHDLIGAGLTKEKASEAAQALREGVVFGEVTNRFNLTESGKTRGEEFYFAAKIHLGDVLFAAARDLSAGQVSDPVATTEGVHILVVEKNDISKPRSFTEARDSVLQDYREAKVGELQKSELEYLRRRADILIAPSYQR